MLMMLRLPDGTRIEALLLARGLSRMRVAVPARNETIEITRDGDNWDLESGPCVEIEAILQLPGSAGQPEVERCEPAGAWYSACANA